MQENISAFKWRELLLNDTTLKPHAKYLAIYLSTHMNESRNFAWPSYTRIQHQTGLSKSTIAKYLKQLEKAQWITIKRQRIDVQIAGGLQASNRYTIKIPKKVSCEKIQLDKGIPSDAPRCTDTTNQVYREEVQLNKGVPSHSPWYADSEDKVYREMETNNKTITKNNNIFIEKKRKDQNLLTKDYDDDFFF